MKPETQYRLLVKCASADRAARILALGAAGLAKRAAEEEEQKAEEEEGAEQPSPTIKQRIGAGVDKVKAFGAKAKGKVDSAIDKAGPKAGGWVSDRLWNNVWDRIPADQLAKQVGVARNMAIGGGALAGLGTAGGIYGLSGLIPGLKKKRLARILAAIAGGGAVGGASGYALNRMLANNARAYNAHQNQTLMQDAQAAWETGNQDKADQLMQVASLYGQNV